MNKRVAIFLFLTIFLIQLCKAQNVDVYEYYSEITGIENSVLFNGVQYLDHEKTINEKNKFLFTSPDYNKGSIHYDGQCFPNVLLKFNLVDDRLLIKLPLDGSMVNFELIAEKVSKFSIGDHEFQKIEFSDENLELSGFHEKLFQKQDFQLYKKHLKSKNRELDKDFVYYEYTSIAPDYFIRNGDKFLEVNSRGDFIQAFPELKELIRDQYRSKKDLRKRNMDAFMIQLLENIMNGNTPAQ